MEFDEDTVIMSLCLSIIALVWVINVRFTDFSLNMSQWYKQIPFQIKYFATYFYKQRAKRIRQQKLDKSKFLV